MLLNRPAVRRALYIFIALLYCVPTLHFILFRTHLISPDFHVYWQTAQRLIHGKAEDIYELSGAMIFRYSPFTLPLFAPLGLLSESTARVLWIFFQLSCTLAALLIFAKTFSKIFPALTQHQVRLSTAFVALLTFRYYLANLRSGQVTPMSILMASLGIYFWFEGRKIVATSFLIGRSFFKIVPGVMALPIILILKKASVRVIFLGTTSALITGTVLSMFFVEIDSFFSMPFQWIDLIFRHHEEYRSATSYSQSLPSVILRLSAQGVISQILYWPLTLFLSISGLALSLATWRRLNLGSEQIQLGVFASVSLFVRLVAPDNYPYANLGLIFPAYYLVAKSWHSARYFALTVFFGVMLSYPGRDTVSDYIFNLYRDHSMPFFSRLIIFGLFLHFLYRDSTAIDFSSLEPSQEDLGALSTR